MANKIFLSAQHYPIILGAAYTYIYKSETKAAKVDREAFSRRQGVCNLYDINSRATLTHTNEIYGGGLSCIYHYTLYTYISTDIYVIAKIAREFRENRSTGVLLLLIRRNAANS